MNEIRTIAGTEYKVVLPSFITKAQRRAINHNKQQQNLPNIIGKVLMEAPKCETLYRVTPKQSLKIRKLHSLDRREVRANSVGVLTKKQKRSVEAYGKFLSNNAIKLSKKTKLRNNRELEQS